MVKINFEKIFGGRGEEGVDEISVRGRINCRLKILVLEIGYIVRDIEFILMLIICLNYSKDEKDGFLYMW